jgi:anti-sigma B factor antagonist
VGLLRITVTAGESGPVLVLAGETDMTTVAELSGALTAQLASGARHLTVDISELRFADSPSMRALALTARALRERNGDMVLLRPQPTVARVLSLTSLDQIATVRPDTSAEAEPEAT